MGYWEPLILKHMIKKTEAMWSSTFNVNLILAVFPFGGVIGVIHVAHFTINSNRFNNWTHVEFWISGL